MRCCLRVFLVLIAALAVVPAAAGAKLTINSFAAERVATKQVPPGRVDDAGRHPDVHIDFALPGTQQDAKIDLVNRVRDVEIRLPQGLIGDPTATPRCAWKDVVADTCAPDAVVGSLKGLVLTPIKVVDTLVNLPVTGTVYNVDPAGSPTPAAPAVLGLVIDETHAFGDEDPSSERIVLPAAVALAPSTGYRLVTKVQVPAEVYSPLLNHSVAISLHSMSLELFGVPGGDGGTPFLTSPTACAAAQTDIALTTPGGVTTTASQPFVTVACDGVPALQPAVGFVPASSRAATPTELVTEVNVAAAAGPVAASTIRDVTVALPEGFALAPGVATGLQTCTVAQFDEHGDTAASCPAGSEVGEARVTTPLLAQDLVGRVFLGEQEQGLPLRFPMYIEVANDEPDVRLKIAGEVVVAADGTVGATLEALPQVPFSSFRLAFRGQPRAVIRTPDRCGSATGSGSFSPWSGGLAVRVASAVAISGDGAGAPCPSRVTVAGSVHAQLDTDQAGASPKELQVDVTRVDRTAALKELRMSLPSGYAARLSAITQPCSLSAAQAGGCAASAKIGNVQVRVGSAPSATEAVPISTGSGSGIYLTEPTHAGDPAGIAIELPAKVGPVDLGTVIMSGRVRLRSGADGLQGFDIVASDLPTRVAGLPISILSMRIVVDRSNFLIAATSCAPRALAATLVAGDGASTRVDDPSPFQPAGCGKVPFAGAAAMTTDITEPGTPTGVSVSLSIPGNDASAWTPNVPDVRPSDLREVAVTLPEGVTLNASVATGLQVCGGQDFAIGSADAAACPAASRVGSATMRTPLIAEPLAGEVFLGEPRTGGAPVDDRYPLLVQLAGVGLRVKLAGEARLDQRTGQVLARFDHLPQVPFSEFVLQFAGGPRAMLATPRACGVAVGAARLTPDSGAAVVRPPLSIATQSAGTRCDVPFAPSLTVAGDALVAGRPGDLSMRIARADGEGALRTLAISMPPGVMGALTAATPCAAEAARSASCPEASRVGGVQVTAGLGSEPVTLPGTIYLTSPTSPGDAAGLAIGIDAKVGPIDLGRVVVAAGIRLRPQDAGLDVRTGELPTMLRGIPLELRTMDMRLNRPGFILNPTGCRPRAFTAAFASDRGQSATAGAAVTPTGCDRLPAGVRLEAAVGTVGRTAVATNPPLTISLYPTAGGAAMRTMVVTMPAGLSADLDRVRQACTQAQADTGTCPPAARVGRASAITSIIAEPLTGDVLLVQQPGSPLPRLLVNLRDRSGAIDLKLTGAVSFGDRGRLRTTFDDNLPDVPLSSFTLALHQDGILKAGVDLCRGRLTVDSQTTFHNQQAASGTITAGVPGCRATAGRATVTARLTHATTRPSLRITATATMLKTVRLILPKGITVGASALRHAIRSPKSVRLTRVGRILTLTSRVGIGRLTLALPRGVRVSAGLLATVRRASGPKRIPAAATLDGRRRRVTLTVTR